MTGTQQLISVICALLTVLAAWVLYIAGTYGFGKNKENE